MGRALSGSAEFHGLGGSSSQSSLSNTDKADTDAAARHGGTFAPILNVAAIRRSFPDNWAEYLRETCKTAYGVQRAFPGIDSHTARDWINGKREPSGSFVAMAIARDPSAIAILGRTE
jgi:hypothetical protein